MFIYRYFKNSLISLSSLFSLKNEKMWKVIIYFLLITMIFTFPMNFYTIQTDANQLTKMTLASGFTEDYLTKLPSDCTISTTIICTESKNYEVNVGKLLVVFNADQSYVAKENSLIFYQDKIIYQSSTDKIESYYNYQEVIHTNDLKGLTKTDATDKLISGFTGEFARMAVVFSIAMYTLSNILMNTLFILIASLLALLLRYGLKKHMTYTDAVKLFVFSSTWPTIICVIFGMFGLYPFMPVIYQFGTPALFLLVFYRNINSVN